MIIRIIAFGTSLSTISYGWQADLEARLQAMFPMHTIEVIARGISGASSARLLRNASAVVADTQPSIVFFEPCMNDAYGGVPVLTTQANIGGAVSAFRAAMPGVKTIAHATTNVRGGHPVVPGLEMLDYANLGWLATNDWDFRRPVFDGIFRGDELWQAVKTPSPYMTDPVGVHWAPQAWAQYITPHMADQLGAIIQMWLVAGTLAEAIGPRPPDAWTPLP